MPERIAPSKLRDRLENRVRKISASYSKEEQLAAIDEIIKFSHAYRDQLALDLGWGPGEEPPSQAEDGIVDEVVDPENPEGYEWFGGPENEG